MNMFSYGVRIMYQGKVVVSNTSTIRSSLGVIKSPSSTEYSVFHHSEMHSSDVATGPLIQ